MYIYVLLLVVLIGFVVLQGGVKEDFISLFTKHTSYLESTAMHPINYSKCVGMPSSDNRIDKAPFYVKTFSGVNYTLGNIAYLLQNEINRLKNVTVASVLIITYGGKQDIHLLFPEFDTFEEKVVPYALVAKNHRWYYLLLYNLYYNAGNFLCLNPGIYGQCYGISERLVVKNYFFIRYMDWYITPCGASGGANPSPMVPLIQQNNFYAHYIPNPSQFSVSPYPNLAYMSQYDTIKYGCDSQLVSENRRFLLLLEQGSRSFGVYRVAGGNPFDFCTSGAFVPKWPLWRIQLSSPVYATFKIETNYIVLVDYNRPIFKITIPTPNTPIVLKLNNEGNLEIYDSKNTKIRTITYNDIMNVIKGIKVGDAGMQMEMDLETIRKNIEEENRRQNEIAARAKEAEEQQLRAAQQEDYNKRICPIGS